LTASPPVDDLLRLEVIADAHVDVAIDGVPAVSRSRVRATGTVADAEIAEAHRRVVASSQAVEVLRAVGRRDELEAEAAARAGVARCARVHIQPTVSANDVIE
jgi:hypothetical protein